MFTAQAELARTQLMSLGPLFQRLYVRKMDNGQYRASYHVSLGPDGRRIFHKDVNMITQELMGSGHDLTRLPSALQALNLHFCNEYIARDGLEELFLFRAEANHRSGHAHLQEDAMNGYEVFHADLEELSMQDGSYISIC